MTEPDRHFQRIPLYASASLYSGSQVWETRMVDISLNGVLLHRPDNWVGAAGERFRIELHLEGGLNISMTVTAAHVEEANIGFHCDKIDMTSFSHLKRLVELNLGDSSLLNRELEALG